MALQRFQMMLRFLHMNDNKAENKTDLLYKLRPIIELFNKKSNYYQNYEFNLQLMNVW